MKPLHALLLTTALLAAGCTGVSARDSGESASTGTLDVDSLLSDPDSYNDKTVRLDACLFVTRHGMSLFNCDYLGGSNIRLISFNPLDPQRDEAYQRVVSAGFASFSNYTVKVILTGQFKFRSTQMPRYVFLIDSAEHFRKLADSP